MNDLLMITFAAIGLLTLLCQWLAWWMKLPAILLLLVAGIVIGPLAGWFHPNELFGPLIDPIISLSVAIILFEGSLTLHFDELPGLRRVIRNLITLGVLITLLGTTLFAHYLTGLSWKIAVLLGAITTVTGPTVITPLLRTVKPNTQLASILRWEGIAIDPIGALLAVLVFGFITSEHNSIALFHTLSEFALLIITGLSLGLGMGYLFGTTLRRHWLPEFLHNISTLIAVITVYVTANYLNPGAGLLAVSIMGITLTNLNDVPIEDILGFKESLSILLISGLFIILAARMNFEHLTDVLWPGCLLFLALQFIVRPFSVLVCTRRSTLNWRERALLAWIAPRGIVAAAIAALFSIHLEKAGVAQANLLSLMTFLIIMGTVIFQSATARTVAQWLGVAEPEALGFLIIGGNPVARTIAQSLVQNGFRVLITSMTWDHIQAARMENLPTYYGNAISEHADRHLDLVGIGAMLAFSARNDLNTLAALRYKQEFGAKSIYTLQTVIQAQEPPKRRLFSKQRGALLFGKDINLDKLHQLIDAGATIRSTRLSDNFDFAAYQTESGKTAIPFFAVDPKGALHFFTVNDRPHCSAGWTIASLIPRN